MKICQKCHLSFDDSANVCPQCGEQLIYIPNQAPIQDTTDHTHEFTAEDISQNKVLAMIPYLMGWIGIIIALLAVNNSAYVAFHVKQALKLQVCSILSAVLCIVPLLGAIAFGVCAIIIFVLTIMGFFNVCGGKAKELPIISGFKFLK